MICLLVRDSPEILITPMRVLVKTPPEAEDEEDGGGKCPGLPSEHNWAQTHCIKVQYSQVYQRKRSGQILR